MKIFINIIFYSFGIVLPLLVIIVAIIKPSKHKVSNIINKVLIAVIIFLIFYMVKVGGINVMKKLDNKKTTTTNTTLKKDTTKKQDIKNNTTTTSNTTSKKTTKIKTTKDIVVSNNNDDLKIVDGILIVNKTYSLPKDFIPQNSYKNASGLRYCTECIDKEAYEQFKVMKADATSIGLNIWIQSGYRSYDLQESLYNKYVNRDGKDAADTYSARPGHSEHQTGLAFDLNSISDDFQYTNEGKWVNENAYKYGYILRYPKGKESITGYKYEPWHLRYVGVELATKLFNNGDWITLEEHFNLTSQYKN